MNSRFRLTLIMFVWMGCYAPLSVAQGSNKSAPTSIDDLFGTASPPAKASEPAPAKKTAPKPAAKEPDSLGALFDEPKTQATAPAPAPKTKFSGFVQSEAAYTYPSPGHGSKFLNKLELAATGNITPQVRWKLSGRASYNAIYDLNNFYPNQVRDDQRFELLPLENYLDISTGNFDFRIGRQHIIWGEAIGLFFADVVSAKDMREFFLPEFDQIRIPQWAARAEYFKNDFHAEAIWIPVMTYDKIGKPGAEFYPFPPASPFGYGYVIENEQRPDRKLSNSAYGTRLSYLKNGWDGSVFYYHSVDASPTFSRSVIDSPATFVYQPIHTKLHQWGATLSKGLRDTVFRAEAVYTRGREFNVSRLSEADGLVPLDTLDYVLGVDLPAPEDMRFNVQFFERWFMDSDPDMYTDRHESGLSFFASGKLRTNLSAEILLARSFNRGDWMARPKIAWKFAPNWRATFGADIFGGDSVGFFGRFNSKDRVYTELRYDF